MNSQDSKAQERQKEENRKNKSDGNIVVDKKLDGPNRPST
ncbi:spore protein [Paenibacillus apiarius]|uniref:Spore protein n=1 Tax=Paenibacillus apiarius TaxID=46240 RepID=A0ABT4DPW1_9BACL|nr:spore protein [Paenibacillus apiarius]MBN3524758.1 spore protein [Paenibacillus apiarius]MCY9515646.1 spore protein [Paenibacillus apiarius]MCY9519281.1 spore protein [Paenibacillus apiarius]MCY9550917.1 spore protein [Paenibacillus apiarius]MCY9558991.1 spore protein [Paenibacillus apiarius]